METLLSLAFDNLSSANTSKIRKGLRQVEGLLAQILLSKPTSTIDKASRWESAVMDGRDEAVREKRLEGLKDDAAFREFFKLQEGFEWNCKFAVSLLVWAG